MYQRFSERHGLALGADLAERRDAGGVKEAIVAVRGDDAYGLLRRESGVHRVQRVPATETQGRIHTSAATVAVLPEAEEVDVAISPSELKIDVFRSSGPGGQSVNTTDSAVRITHLPDRARRQPAGSEIAAPEQDQGDGGAAGPTAGPHARRAGGGAVARPARDGGHRRSLGQDPDLQLSPEPGDRPPDQPVALQPGGHHQRTHGRAGGCASGWPAGRSRMAPEVGVVPAYAPERADRDARCAPVLPEPRREALRLWRELPARLRPRPWCAPRSRSKRELAAALRQAVAAPRRGRAARPRDRAGRVSAPVAREAIGER